MTLFSIISYIFTLAVALAYVNARFIKMETTIAVMTGSLILSLALLIFNHLNLVNLAHPMAELLKQIDFRTLLLDGMLSFLLFAGALTIDVKKLRQYKWEIMVLASLSTIISSVLIGFGSFYLLRWLNFTIPLIYCLLFGALISPTDPIAVLAMFKELKAPKGLDICVAGESLFNDGVGIVIFLSLYHVAFSAEPVTIAAVSQLFLHEAIGGILYGMGLGLVAFWLIKSIDNHKIEILLTLAVATGGYALAQALEISGPLAMVVAGIFVGNFKHHRRIDQAVRANLEEFWELIDEILNALLFVMIGLELLLLNINLKLFLASLFSIALVLSIRLTTVGIPISIFKRYVQYPRYTIRILVWGGLRGGLAVALALALPEGKEREIILALTYAVVVFAIVVQGSTVKQLIKRSKQSIVK